MAGRACYSAACDLAADSVPASALIREGRPPSVPEAADPALVSVATAYRYFSSAEDLWWEASNVAIGIQGTLDDALQRVEAAGSHPHARLEALIRSLGFAMLDDRPYRQIAKTAVEQWFRQADAPDSERVPIRQGRRNEQIRNAIAPLSASLASNHIDRIAHALGQVIGTEAMIALTDGVGLDVPAAKKDAARLRPVAPHWSTRRTDRTSPNTGRGGSSPATSARPPGRKPTRTPPLTDLPWLEPYRRLRLGQRVRQARRRVVHPARRSDPPRSCRQRRRPGRGLGTGSYAEETICAWSAPQSLAGAGVKYSASF